MRVAALALCLMATSVTTPADTGPLLACTLGARAVVAQGAPLVLRFTLRNRGTRPVHVLTWGTPFEGGFFAPYVRVLRDGVELPYQGASIKRGEPSPDEYLRVAPGRSRRASVTLQPAFGLDAPGRYRIEPRLTLHDVVVGDAARVPRPRAQHRSVDLPCPALEVTVR